MRATIQRQLEKGSFAQDENDVDEQSRRLREAQLGEGEDESTASANVDVDRDMIDSPQVHPRIWLFRESTSSVITDVFLPYSSLTPLPLLLPPPRQVVKDDMVWGNAFLTLVYCDPKTYMDTEEAEEA